MTPRDPRLPLLSATATATVLGAAAFLVAACSSASPASPAGTATATASPSVLGSSAATGAPSSVHAAPGLPRPDHVVVVIEENHSYSDVIGDSAAPYINSLAARGARFSSSFAITHPSEPNYLALFAGTTEELSDDSCPHTFTDANLASALLAAGHSFAGYSESLPSDGYTGCTAGDYARKHAPWVNFTDVPAADNRSFAAFPSDFSTLPTVAVVVPNLADDMHNGTVAEGDAWLRANLDAYARWAPAHNSELIVTWDEDDNSANNQIPTLIVGADVKPGTYSETINHYSVLRTLEDFYGLPHAGSSATAASITDIFTPNSPTATS